MFSKELQGTIEDALDFIENNITKKITLDLLSEHSHLSKFHLHRLLRQALGIPIMDYIRARKITASLDPLFSRKYSVLQVGLMFGFDHEQSYIRAFKKQFGITPTEFRRRPVDGFLTQRANLTGLSRIEGGIVFQPVTRFKENILVAGMLYDIDIAENLEKYTANQAGKEFYYEHRHRIGHKVNEMTYVGLTRYHWVNGQFATTYLPSVQVTSVEDLPQDLTSDCIPRSKYVVYTYIGGFHPRYLTIKHLEQIWMCIESNRDTFCQSEPFHFEVIKEEIATEVYCEVDIYIPVTYKVLYDDEGDYRGRDRKR